MDQVCTTWLAQYGKPARALKRPAAFAPSAKTALKRPAAGCGMAPASSSDAAAVVPVECIGAADVEKACGERYRREVVDKGLGFTRSDMQKRLEVWGFNCSREAC